MGTTSEKLTYLNETKRQIKETINFAGGTLTNETFRQYPEKLYDKYLDILKDNGEELFEGLPKDLGSGTSLSLNNTANTRMKMSLAPSELEQATTTGKNLFDLKKYFDDRNATYTLNDDGSITFASQNALYTQPFVFSDIDVVVSISGIIKNITATRARVQLLNGANSVVANLDDSTTKVENVQACKLRLDWLATGTMNIKNIMLNFGSTATSYEPYTGGIASPNPDYPQDIHTITGDNEIVVSNKNIIPFTNQDFTYKDVRYYCVNGGLYLNGTSTGETLSNRVEFKNNFSFWLNAGTYYFTRGTFNGLSLKKYIDDSNILTNSGSFTLTEKTQLYIGFYVYNKTFNNQAIECQIEVNPQATSYVSHQEQTLPLTLGTLEYCKIGNYADEFYLATESDTSLVAGKWYLKKNIGKVVFDGSEEGWVYNSSGSWNFRYPTNIKENTSGSTVYDLYSNYYKAQPASGNNYAIGQLSNNKAICFRNTDISTLANFKTWVSTHNTTVYYVLDASSYTLLNDTLQEQLTNIYNKALSYQDQTNISQENNDLPFVISASAIAKYDLNEI